MTEKENVTELITQARELIVRAIECTDNSNADLLLELSEIEILIANCEFDLATTK